MNPTFLKPTKTLGWACAIVTLLLVAASVRAQTVVYFSDQPQSVNNYAYQPVYFFATAYNDGPDPSTYQWRVNGAPIANATNTSFGFITSTNDNGTQVDCVATAGSLMETSTVATVTIVPGVVISANKLGRDNWSNNDYDLWGIETGASGPPDLAGDTVTSLQLSGLPQYSKKRIRGFFTPPVTTNYVFFCVSDSRADLYLSPNSDQPNSKQMVAQNNYWVGTQWDWTASGGGSGLLNVTNVRSDTFSPDGGTTTPFSGGIWLTNGVRYYMEVHYFKDDGSAWLGVNYKYVGAPDPVSGSASLITSAMMSYPALPLSVLNFTSQPQNVTNYAYQPVYFSASATNDGGMVTTYQWRRNGVNVPNATDTNFGFILSTNDNGAQVDCVATAGALSKTSSVATVTIQAGGGIAAGQLAKDNWSNSDLYLSAIETGASGPPDLAEDTVSSLQLTDFPEYCKKRIRGFFTPPVTTNYVFFCVSDRFADLYLSTSDQPNNKRMVAQNTDWVGTLWDWTASGGGSGSLNVTNVRSDTFSPDGGATTPFSGGIWLTNGRRYYIEVQYWKDDGTRWLGVNYKFVGAPDPVSGSDSLITSADLSYWSLLPPPATLTVTRSGSTVNVSWTPTGGTLQSCTDLSSPVWTTVGPANPASVPIGTGNLFFRVVQLSP